MALTKVSYNDSDKLEFGSDADLRIDWDGSRSLLNSYTSGTFKFMSNGNQEFLTNGSETMIKAVKDGTVELYYDNAKKLATESGGVAVTGGLTVTTNISLVDNGIIKVGTGDDLQILHDGSHSYIKDTATGWLVLSSNNLRINNAANDEPLGQFTEDGSAELYYDGSKKIFTDTNGVTLGAFSTTGASVGITIGDFGIRSSKNAATFEYHNRFVNTNGQIGYISTQDSATQYNTSSDYRLKENEVAISNGITRLKTLKPYRFNFKSSPSKTVDGFFAHEVTPAVPEAITGEKDGAEMQGIDQSKLVPLLTAALQEAITKIETLETKVAALEAA